jgi:lipid II:glycine glycyltransferase (peptidoglycan interpeptide bridge formation enzyme)
VKPLSVEVITARDVWNDALRHLPYAHVLQTWEWGEFKRITTGWQPIRFAFKREDRIVAMASVGVRSVARMLRVMVVSKGPALAYDDPILLGEVLAHLERYARRRGAVWLKIDPDVIEGTGIPGDSDDKPDSVGLAVLMTLAARGWQLSADQVQFRNTVSIDLTRSTDELLAAISQNTRRKIRIAEREGVTVRVGTTDDLPVLYDLYRMTGERDHFLIRPSEYYERAWRTFIDAGLAHPLIAELNGVAVAHVILFHFGRKCWYFYGASSNEYRETMPNYALQWHAMQWAKTNGYTIYDMWGAPNHFIESDPMWGVYTFKRGFRGAVVRHIGAWDYAPFAPLYALYTRVMPRVIGLLRRRANARSESLGATEPTSQAKDTE